MIITIYELRQFISTTESDASLTLRIQAVESFICKYTNNDFISRTTGEKDYPANVKLGAINMINYDLSMMDKAGISSETISRHSVSYTDAGNGEGGYPAALTAFLKPYVKARF